MRNLHIIYIHTLLCCSCSIRANLRLFWHTILAYYTWGSPTILTYRTQITITWVQKWIKQFVCVGVCGDNVDRKVGVRIKVCMRLFVRQRGGFHLYYNHLLCTHRTERERAREIGPESEATEWLDGWATEWMEMRLGIVCDDVVLWVLLTHVLQNCYFQASPLRQSSHLIPPVRPPGSGLSPQRLGRNINIIIKWTVEGTKTTTTMMTMTILWCRLQGVLEGFLDREAVPTDSQDPSV